MLHSRVRLQHLMRKSLYHYRLSVSRVVVSLSFRAGVHLWRLKWHNSIIKLWFISSCWRCRLLKEYFIHVASGVAIVILAAEPQPQLVLEKVTSICSIYESFNVIVHANHFWILVLHVSSDINVYKYLNKGVDYFVWIVMFIHSLNNFKRKMNLFQNL